MSSVEYLINVIIKLHVFLRICTNLVDRFAAMGCVKVSYCRVDTMDLTILFYRCEYWF